MLTGNRESPRRRETGRKGWGSKKDAPATDARAFFLRQPEGATSQLWDSTRLRIPSPFVTKAEVLLKMAKLPHRGQHERLSRDPCAGAASPRRMGAEPTGLDGTAFAFVADVLLTRHYGVEQSAMRT